MGRSCSSVHQVPAPPQLRVQLPTGAAVVCGLRGLRLLCAWALCGSHVLLGLASAPLLQLRVRLLLWVLLLLRVHVLVLRQR